MSKLARFWSAAARSSVSASGEVSAMARAPVERLRFGVAALLAVNHPERIENDTGPGAVGTERVLVDRQGPLCERLGLSEFRQVCEQPCQVVEHVGRLGFVLAEPLDLAQREPQQPFGFDVIAVFVCFTPGVGMLAPVFILRIGRRTDRERDHHRDDRPRHPLRQHGPRLDRRVERKPRSRDVPDHHRIWVPG